MKNMIKLNFLLAFVLILSSCFNQEENLSEDEFNTVTIQNDYSVDLPNYMAVAKDLNDDASLQYQNIFKQTYVIVIDELKEEIKESFKLIDAYDENKPFLENYRSFQMQSMAEGIAISNKSEVKPLKINGLDGEIVEFEGNVEGIEQDIFYFLTFIEGTEQVYMMMAWTLKSRKDKYISTFNKMARSFKLANK